MNHNKERNPDTKLAAVAVEIVVAPAVAAAKQTSSPPTDDGKVSKEGQL